MEQKKYYDQIQMQLYVTGKKWCDYFGFRIFPDGEVFKKIDIALPHAINILEDVKNN